MWTCVSKARLRREASAAGLVLAAGAGVFWLLQNRFAAPGGAIALPKLVWLFLALFAWFVLPVLLARDAGLAPAERRLFRLFWLNMAARGMVELVMIYGWRNWHPYYGAAHDLASIALLAVLGARLPAGWARTHAAALALMLAAETGFALYFSAHFHTRGEKALYFVPGQERYSAILMATSFAVGAVALYGPWFFRRWLGGAGQDA